MTDRVQLQNKRRKPLRRYKHEQARISRRILYRVTAFYTTYSLIMFYVGLRSKHPYIATASYAVGFPVWTYLEYLAHRFVLHGRFKKSKHRWKVYKTLAN